MTPLCSKRHRVMKYLSTMRPKSKSENVMTDVYLGVAVAGGKFASCHGGGFRVRAHVNGRVSWRPLSLIEQIPDHRQRHN